jgi:hypothetical protein
MPCQMVGTPALKVTPWSMNILSVFSGWPNLLIWHTRQPSMSDKKGSPQH